MNSYDFKKDLARGEAGAALFHAHYTRLIKLDGRKADFQTPTGKLLELKTDFTSMAKTKNFFMERYSNKEKQKPGGPWQSDKNGVEWFCYFFILESVVYWFKTVDLVAMLESKAPTFQERTISNTGWASHGYLVPRDTLEAICVRKENIIEDVQH